ncbi:MAG: helix-turn-helix transcriptional regulator, partial [Mesorhizobium sp.]
MQQARAQAGYASPSDAARALREINKNTLISHENGNRPLSRKAAEKYGRLFGVDPGWLLFDADGVEAAPVHLAASPITIDVPIVSWISAGELGSQDSVVNLSDYPTIPTADLE